MADVKLVTLVAPKLTSKQFYPAGIVTFTTEFDKYIVRCAGIPGMIAQPLEMCIETEMLQSWVDMGRIPDESDVAIRAFLTAQSILDTPLIDVRTVFTHAVLSAAFNPDLESAARVQSLFTCVMKLVRAKNLSTYLLRKSNMKEVQNLILDAITPADAANVIRLKIKNREAAFSMAELSDEILIIVKYEDQKKGIAASQTPPGARPKPGILPPAAGQTPVFPPAIVPAGQAAGVPPAVEQVSPLMDRAGKPVKCHGCGANHYVQQCPHKTPVERAALLAAADKARLAAGWVRNAQGRLVKSVPPAAVVTPVVTPAVVPPVPQHTQLKSGVDEHGMEIADAYLGDRVLSPVFVDCGATYPIICLSLIRCLEVLRGNVVSLRPIPHPNLETITLGDNESVLNVLGLFTDTLTFKDCPPISLNFLVVGVDLPHIILGNRTLHRYGVRVKELLLQAIAHGAPASATEDMLDPPTLSMLAIGTGFESLPYRYEPNRSADLLEPDMMEKVLLPASLDAASPINDIPAKEVLFPIVETTTLSIMEQAVLDSFYSRLDSLLYQGDEPYLGEPFRIDLVPNAIPHRCKNRGLTPPVRKFLIQIRDTWLAKGYISPLSRNVEWCSFVFAVPKPGAEGYRAVVDYVGLNLQTRATTYPMPFLESSIDKLTGSAFFAILDLLKGYRQCAVDPTSREYLAIMLLDQIYSMDRLVEGAKNAVAYFQALFAKTLQQPLTAQQQLEVSSHMPPDEDGGFAYVKDWDQVRLWIDDSMLHGRLFIPFIHMLERTLIRLRDCRLRLNLAKSMFCAKEVVHVGRHFSEGGVKLDPTRVLTLLNIPRPETGSDLMYFLNSLNWNRMCIPHYSSHSAPLYALLQEIADEAGSRKKRPAARFLLKDRWTPAHEGAFEMLKNILARQVQLAYPKEDHSLFLFSDASDLFHAAVLMQCASTELDKPLEQRNFEPLGFCCGSFRGPSRNWDIQSKEGFAVLYGLDKFRDLIFGRVTLCIDHHNLKPLFSSAEPQVDKITQRRILRWRETLSQWDYSVLFLPGSMIPWVDYLTRGGAITADLYPSPLVPDVVAPLPEDDSLLSPPAVLYAMHLINSTSDESYIWPSMTAPHVLEAHSEYDSSEDPWFKDQSFQLLDGLYQTSSNICFVPTTELQTCILIAAHSGAAMHRGIPLMIKLLQDHFIWETMIEDATLFVNQCLHCLVSKEGVKVPRPWGNVIRGMKPNEVIHLDFVTLLGGNKKQAGKKPECCHIVDSFSTYHSLIATDSTTAVDAAKALQHWVGTFGFPKWIVSDQGSAFISELFQELTRVYRVQHHMVVAHTHTGNGKVERAHRTFLAMLRCLLSELRIPVENWEELLPLIQHGINNTPSVNLAGKAPIEAFLGLPCNSPLDGLLYKARVLSLDTARSEDFAVIYSKCLTDYMAGRTTDQARLVEIVNDTINRRRIVNDKYNRKRFEPEIPNFIVGSYVMVSSVGHVPKLVSNWTGPYRVVEVVNSHIYKVQDLLKEDRFLTVHAARMLTFRNDFLHTEIGVKEQAAYFKSGFEVNAILDCRQGDALSFEVWINWLGFDTMDNTWEDAKGVWDTASESMTTFIVSMTDLKLAKALCKYIVADYSALVSALKEGGKAM